MIVKNESKVIVECLESVHNLIDYYVINDTGSTDDTVTVIKQFFDSKKIQGEIISHEFRTCTCHPQAEHKQCKYFHFGNNRTYALNKCRGKGDYVMFMDADDTIEGKLVLPAKLMADQYYLTVRTDQNIYYKPLLIKNDPKLKWVWLCGLHEFLTGKAKTTMRLMGEYAIVSRRQGARNENPLKYYQDAEYLEELLKQSTNDPKLHVRYLYYLAQSWFDAREYTKSIAVYNQVIELSGDDPDRAFSSRYMIGRSHVLKGSPSVEIERAFKECHEKHLNRAEPLFQLLCHFNELKDYQRAYDYGIKAAHIPMPVATQLYIEKAVYDYRLLDELIFCASQLGKYRQALKWCAKLLKEKRYPKESMQTITENILALRSD